MDTFISSVTKCISDACQNAVSIDFEKLIDEFETKSASLARPLFSSDNADFTTEKAHSYCINPDVIQSQSNTQDFSSAYPKVMKFIYPSEDEIKAEQLDVMHLLTYKSVNETRNVVSPDFDDSFTSLDLTQIMNTSEVNYRNLSSYIPNQTFPDSPEKLKVCNKTAVSSECRYFPNELQMPVCVISSKEKLIQAVTQDDLTNLQPILNDANNVPCLSDHAKNPVYEDISLKSGVIPNLLLKPSSEFETIEAPTSEAQTFVHHISLYKSCMPHESNTNPNFTGFKTGKGDSVMLTSASSKKFAQTLVDALDVVEESVVVESNSETRDYCSTGFKTGKGDSVMLTSASSKKFAQTLVDALDVVEESVVVESNSETRDYCSTGFKTGKGDSVMLTSASSKKFAQTLVDALDVVEESVVVESNSETRDYCSTGFKTGKGDSVMLTSASSKQFAQTLADSVSVHIDNIYLERNSQFLNVSEINDALDCNRKRVITVPCVSSESLSCEVDPLVGCCFDTQFDFSLEVSKETSQTVETDLELELEREKARINQQDLIANKKSLISSNQYAISDHTTTATTTSWKFQSCGLLWSIRRRCNGNDVLNASEKQSSVNWKVLLSNQKPLTTTLHLPKYIKFPEEISKWSLQTSDKLYWLWDMKCIMDADDKSFLPVYYNYRDFTVIPDKFGCVGKQEIVNAFLSCPQIHSNLVSFGWIDNHYSQIMWKIGTIALLYSDLSTTLLSDYCIPSHVLNELHYRYDREIEGCQRSALRKIVEQDDTAARRLILCVSYLEVSEKCVKACLTDGWYQISWNPDPMLITLIKAGKIRVGSKLVTAGAELITTDPLCTENRSKRNCSTSNTSRDEFRHLYGDDSTAIGVSLKLHGNSTRPASWHSRLGFSVKQPSSGSGLYPVPLCTISSDGGLCSSIRVVIQRRYSLQYMETLEVPEQNTDTSATLVRTNSGTDESFLKSRLNRRRIFRSERAEEAEVRLHETMKSRIIDSALDKLVFNDPNKRRIQPTPEQLNALGNDGEALLHMILNAPDSAEAESNLTSMQHDAIQLYKESVIRDAVTENVPPRQVTPLLRLRVSGIHPKDIAGNYGACITLWSPTDEMISILKEGEVVEFYRLQASVTRVNDPFASPPPLSGFVKPIGVNIPSGYVLSLSGGRTTRVFSLGHISKLGESIPIDKFACIYRPRVTLTVTDVYRIANEQEVSVMNSNNKGNIEVDMRCLIIAVYLTSTNLTKSWKDQSINKSIDNSRLFDTPFKYPSSDVDCVYVTDVDCKSETCLLCVIKFWDGLQSLHLTDILQVGRVLCFTDLQLRRCQTIHTVSRLDQPSRAIPLVNLNYTSASNVATEKSSIRHSSRMTSTNESNPDAVSYLQQVVKDFLCSKLGRNFDLQTSDSPVNYAKSIPPFPSNIPNSTSFGLSTLLRSSASHTHSTPINTRTPRKCIPREDYSMSSKSISESPNQSVLKQSLPLKEQNFTPIKRFSSTSELQKQQCDDTPKNNNSPYVRTLPNRSASRTGLSRRLRSRSNLIVPLNSSTTIVSDMKVVSDTKPYEDIQITKSPPSTIPSLPIPEDLSSTPEPKAKRRRCSQNSDKYTDSPEVSSNKQPSELIQSPIDILNTSNSDDENMLPSNPYELQTSPYNLNDSQIVSSSQFGNDNSFDSSDMSIADLVKTRQRRYTCTPQIISTPPLPRKSLSNHRLSLKKRISK